MVQEKLFHDNRLPEIEARRSIGNHRSFKPHVHQAFSIGAIDDGRVRVDLGPNQLLLAPGELILINPGTLHACNPLGGAARSFSMLHVGLRLCLEVQQTLWRTAAFLPLSPQLLVKPNLFDDYQRTLQTLFAKDRDLLEKEESVSRLLVAIFQHGVTAVPAPPPTPLSNHQVNILQSLLAADLEREISLTDLARQQGDNPYTLLRRFKAATGITPHAFRLNRRIDRAKELLQNGVEIADVALQCGFFDQSHLHRHFKALTAMTPRQYQINFVQ
jgi:AraC-like DNA-binding protein